MKRFLEKVKEAEGTFSYQNVTLLSFENAKGAARDAKNSLLGRIKTAMQSRLEVAENHQVLNAAIILNTEGWERSNEDGEDLTFVDDSIVQLYEHFKVPLTNAGMSGSLLLARAVASSPGVCKTLLRSIENTVLACMEENIRL